MSRASRWIAVVLAGLAVSAYAQDEKLPPPENATTPDATLHATLREVINRGVEVYNRGDYGGCYRIFEGSLITTKPLLSHRPDLQKVITKALAEAESNPIVWQRAFTLRSALDKVRAEINPKKGKVEEKKPDDLKPSDKDKDKDKPKPDDPKPDDKDKDKSKPDDKDKDKGKPDDQPKPDDKGKPKDGDKDKETAKKPEILPPPFEDKDA